MLPLNTYAAHTQTKPFSQRSPLDPKRPPEVAVHPARRPTTAPVIHPPCAFFTIVDLHVQKPCGRHTRTD
ncbi:hypothetical protein EJ06DRAFT_528565 [Trichodelitschia bisporula]|uniref:Uncharacterized protein n=1 Tax=Trichodelitschia bisporula TaxID=703511 RepID=A0A6G1I310_9PEZI|nr:hypothetical protein EJ06DRAFT_528565 [Trichodelitschia bisporula]